MHDVRTTRETSTSAVRIPLQEEEDSNVQLDLAAGKQTAVPPCDYCQKGRVV